MLALLLATLAVAQAFEMTPMCRTMYNCQEEMMTMYTRCMNMANTIMPDMMGTTECERNFWTIVMGMMKERMNMTTMFATCMNSTDPTTLPATPPEMMTECEMMMKTYPNLTYTPIVAQMFKLVEAEMQTFMNMFPLNTEFNKCVSEAFFVSKRCCTMMDCCNVACTCRQKMNMPTPSIILNRMYTKMRDYLQVCKMTPTEFATDATTPNAATTTTIVITTTNGTPTITTPKIDA